MKICILSLLIGFLNIGKPIKNLQVKTTSYKKEVKMRNYPYQVFLNSQNNVEYLIYDFKNRKRNYKTPQILNQPRFKYEFQGKQVNIRVKDGWLVGFDKGEWGGSLVWFNEKGTYYKRILSGNIRNIFKIENDYFILEGSTRLPTKSKGQIIKLNRDNENWKIKEQIRLPSTSYTATINNENEIIVATAKGILKVNSKMNIEYLIEEDLSSDHSLKPNSAVIKKNKLYLGIHGGVLKIDLKNKKKEWLVEKLL